MIGRDLAQEIADSVVEHMTATHWFDAPLICTEAGRQKLEGLRSSIADRIEGYLTPTDGRAGE